MIWIMASGFMIWFAMMALSARIETDSQIVTSADTLRGAVVLDRDVRGKGRLVLTWRDSYGRIVAERESHVRLDGARVDFELDLACAVALQNFLDARLSVGSRVFAAPRIEFIVTPLQEPWTDYQIIMYYPYERSVQPALGKLGITAGKIAGAQTRRPDGAAAWYPFNYRFYCDQIATFFYAAYHTPVQDPKNKMYLLARERYRQDRTSREPFYRKPCFHDKKALAEATERLRTAVKTQKRFRPLFYAHCDEAGVADLVAAWDFCFQPKTLSAMREWLIEQYGSLDGINNAWDTCFSNLDEVTPFTTDEMMARGDDNLSPWADHRHFMNKTFADVVAAGTAAVLDEDPDAMAGLVGCQMPAAFGGYDYWLLSRAMTCIEPYNIGNNREIWRSLAPLKPALTTAFGFGPKEVWRLWHQMLHGDLGIIIYDEEFRYLDEHGETTPLAAAIAPTYRELTGGIARLLSSKERCRDGVGIHYSHPSLTAHWMLDVRQKQQPWIERESWQDRLDSEFLRLRESWTKVLEDNMRQYDFIAYGQLENGEFDEMDMRLVILPQSIAMSQAECMALRRFVERGGMLVADSRTALMNEHCRRTGAGQLDDLFGLKRTSLDFEAGPVGLRPVDGHGVDWMPSVLLANVSAAEPGITPVNGAVTCYEDSDGTPAVIVRRYGKGTAVYLNAVFTDYHRWRLRPPEHDGLSRFVEGLLDAAGVTRRWDIRTVDGGFPHGVEAHTWEGGHAQVVALQRNYQMRVNELGPPEYADQEALEEDIRLVLNLDSPATVYDQRVGSVVGRRRCFELKLGRWEPLILVIRKEPVGEITIDAPARVAPGDLAAVHIRLDAAGEGSTCAFRVKAFAPDGQELTMLTRTIAAPSGHARWLLPVALSDAEGEYMLTVRDVATGAAGRCRLVVKRQ